MIPLEIGGVMICVHNNVINMVEIITNNNFGTDISEMSYL